MSDCRKCAKFEECAVDEDCALFVDKPMTNADCIRTMTDEELAEWIAKDLIEPGYDTYDRTYRRWLDWLKSPADKEHGRNISNSGFLCSECHFGDFGGFHGYKPNYCPNCGAKMEVDE